MLPDKRVIADLKTMCNAIYDRTIHKSTETEDIEGSAIEEEAHPILENIHAESPSELQSVLEIQQLASEMVLTTLADESDDSLDNSDASSSVLQKIKAVRKQIELIQNCSFQRNIQGATNQNKNIQFALTIINFITAVLSIFIVIFGFSGDDAVVNSTFA